MKNSLRTAINCPCDERRVCCAVCGVGGGSINVEDTGQLDQLIEDQLMIAGARLAALLNAISE